MLIKELYEDSIKYEESFIAHYILFLLHEGRISLADDVNKLKLVKADEHKFWQLYKQNPLGFSLIKVFALKHSGKIFVFIFAKDKSEAISFFQQTFNQKPINCHEYSLDTPMNLGNRFLSFRDLRKETNEFPSLIGFYEKNYG